MSLQKIQEDLNAPKDLYNKFAGFKYRSAESILQALKPLLAEHKYSLVVSDTLELIGDRYYVKATSCLYDDKMTLIAQASAYAREELTLKGQQSSQITGGTSSYARKYSLNGLFLIDDNKDADSHDNSNSAATKPAPPTMINAQQVVDIGSMIMESKLSMEQVCASWKINNIQELQSGNYQAMVSWLEGQE